jgi:hypothetical protein
MSATKDNGQHDREDDQDDLEGENDDAFDPAEYNTMVELERLESLEEEMQELGVASLDEIRRRIEELNAQLDENRNG